MSQICKNLEKPCRKIWKKLVPENKENESKTPPKRFQTLTLSRTLNPQTYLNLSFSGAFCKPMSPNLGPKLYQILSYPDRWKKCVKVGEGVTNIYIQKHDSRWKRARKCFGAVLGCFPCFRRSTFFRIFDRIFRDFCIFGPFSR